VKGERWKEEKIEGEKVVGWEGEIGKFVSSLAGEFVSNKRIKIDGIP